MFLRYISKCVPLKSHSRNLSRWLNIPSLNSGFCGLEAKQAHQSSRQLCRTAARCQEIKVTFIRATGEKIVAKGNIGDSLLDVVVNNNIDLDGFGACEGTLTCSTCHLIFKQDDFAKLPDKPSDEELDMLDLAYDLTDTSRLGCQIILSKDMDGLEVHVPATINDARSV